MRIVSLSCILLVFFDVALASEDAFSKGPVFTEYGENTIIENGLQDPKGQSFKVVFDVSTGAEAETVSRQFNSVARFINMHVRAGVPQENIHVGLVVHGKASFDLMRDDALRKQLDRPNSSAGLVSELLANGVEVYLCGQSAAYYGIRQDSLIDGVQLSLSAMTANALLQQQGYTLNPF